MNIPVLLQNPQNIVIGLIIIIVLVSLKGYNDPQFLNRYLFNISGIKQAHQYERILTCSFLHADYMHLGFNMYALYMFGPFIVAKFGIGIFLLIYFASVLGGSFVSYVAHKNQYSYSALGASGGVTGLVLAFVVIMPDAQLGLMFLPIPLPGYIFAFLYLVYSIYAMHKQLGNIGHDAHLGGAAVGLLIPIILNPSLLIDNKWQILLLLLPIFYLAVYIFKKR